MKTQNIKIILFFSTLFFSLLSWCRPEFALKMKLTQCSMCHVSPFGGGPKNIFGKSIGHHGYTTSSPFATQDLLTGDFRMLGSAMENKKVSSGGLSLMSVSLTVNLPLLQQETPTPLDFRIVSQFISPELQQGGGLSYLQWQNFESQIFYIAGKFYRPFGIPSDEHRTYTKMINNSSLRDYIYGLGISKKFDEWQMDLTFGNDSTNATLIKDPSWITTFNGRTFLTEWPAFINLSFETIQHPSNLKSNAWSVGGGYFISDFNLSLTSEYVRTHNYNPLMKQSSFFYGSGATDLLYQKTIAEREADAVSTTLSYEKNEKLSTYIKHDELVFDYRYPADSFTRTAFGLRYYLNPHLMTQYQAEIQKNGRSDLDPSVKANSNGFFFILRASI